ncbi:MAG: hypothetical protein ABL933_06460 [Methyloglobulus sp.]|nr:hypothetical protein [Methyloglobulus sp.]
MTTLTTVAITVALSYTPILAFISFQPLPLSLLNLLGGIIALCITTAECAKHNFYRQVKF